MCKKKKDNKKNKKKALFLTLFSPSISWDIGEWSECSKTCGLGMQHRQVLCRQVYANRTLNVHTSHCRHLERPETASSCQLKICSEWQIRSEWTSVSGSSQPNDWIPLSFSVIVQRPSDDLNLYSTVSAVFLAALTCSCSSFITR